MRFLGFAVVTGAAIVLGACGGGEKAATDTAAAVDTAAAAPAPAAAPAAGTMQPITGTTHEVKMVGDAQGYRFEPAEITAKPGDGIKFVFVSSGPHNVAFDPTTVPAEFKAVMLGNMPEQQSELSGKMLLTAGETYTISLGGVAPGTYEFICTPHIAMNMKGKIIVQ
jgi:plastocyanin